MQWREPEPYGGIADPVVFTSPYAGVPGNNRRAALVIAYIAGDVFGSSAAFAVAVLNCRIAARLIARRLRARLKRALSPLLADMVIQP
jgi:hypothetical protein